MRHAEAMPVVFVGHGSPMNAIEDNTWSKGFRELGRSLPDFQAIVSISAHWYVPGTHVTSNTWPPTIHDFEGFPAELHALRYPAPGCAELADRVVKEIGRNRASVSEEWGLDHGTWTVLRWLRPDADRPVVQISIDTRLELEEHVAIGRALAPLREKGVLVLGSGNLTHDLRDAQQRMSRGDERTPEWAARFDDDVASALEQHDEAFLVRALETEAGRRSHPTLDHYLPLLYVIGATNPNETVRFPITGFDAGSLSMRSVRIG